MKRWNLRTQLNISFIIVVAFVLISVLSMLHITLHRGYRERENALLESYCKQIANNIDARIDYYVSYIKLISGDRQLALLLANDNFEVVNARLQSISADFMTLSPGRIEGVRLHRNGYYSYRGDYLDVGGVFENFKQGGDAYQNNYYVTCTYLNNRNEKIFSIFSKLHQSNLNREYFIELRIYESDFYSFFSANTSDSRICLALRGMLMSTNERGVFLTRLHEKKRARTYGVSYGELPEIARSVRAEISTQNYIKVVADTGVEYLDRSYWTMFRGLAPLILIILTLAIGLVRLITIYIQKRLKLIQKQISALSRGDLQYDMRISGKDEFGVLSEELENTRTRITDLMEKNAETNEQIRIAEMAALRAQINSHFLFNALSSIKWLSKRGDVESLTLAVDNLTSFLRYSLSLDENQVSLASEIEQLNAYIYLQKLRYQNEINFHIDIEEEMLSYKTVKLILQPLFENAIYHGRGGGGAVLNITLYAETDGAAYSLIVEDDGVGMTGGQINDVFGAGAADMPADAGGGVKSRSVYLGNGQAYPSEKGYGLRNIIKRVQICTDGKGAVSIESKPGAYTKVTVTQPV